MSLLCPKWKRERQGWDARVFYQIMLEILEYSLVKDLVLLRGRAARVTSFIARPNSYQSQGVAARVR